ncbi:MAG TPA: tetratricopeptide repeat protein [Rhizomicrobium sp.]|jgi:tetratricopeptide (TPR) repeat protein|nr:tetratricopeptide repeat protein [Rhizomicrobium sp.]
MRVLSRFIKVACLAAAALIAGACDAFAAKASPLDDPALGGRNRYDRCLVLVKRDAARAETEAAGWSAAGGGAAALHCEALALVELKRFAEAAQKLEDAANQSAAAPSLRAELLDQAGNAWLLAGAAGKAESALSAALALEPKSEDVLADRARERGAAKNWTGAVGDLTSVLALDPDRADIYVLRASALHAQGRKAEAGADIGRALGIYPDYPEALVERGVMRLETGDSAGARADWLKTAQEAPDSDAASAALAHLKMLGAATSPAKR